MVWRFNPPPAWPLPRDFLPPPGWRPDPAWPKEPYGWQLWTETADTPPTVVRPRATSARLAPHRYRLLALVVDLLIVLALFGVLAVLGRLTDAALKTHVVDLLTTFIALALCTVSVLGLTAWLTGGQTMGKALFGLVEARIGGKPWNDRGPGLAWSVGRHSIGYAVVDVFGIGMVAALFTPRRRCLHDLAFASEVLLVDEPATEPMTWRKRLDVRFKTFTDNLEVGVKGARERHRRAKFLWDWLSGVITKSAAVVFLIAKHTHSAAAISTTPATAPAAGVHPAAALGAKPTTVLWTSTGLATVGAGLAVAAILSGPSVNQINVAFSYGTVGQPETYEIYLMHADGSHKRVLTHNTADDKGPRLFRDRSVVFSSNRDGNYNIYSMKADGSQQRRLTDNAADDLEPAWSSDGRKVVFVSARDGNDQIYTMNADGSRQRRLAADGANDSEPDWSPAGRIVFVSDRDGNDQIYVMNADGSRQRRLTGDAAADNDPVWSPDGRRIAFTSDRDGDHEIYVMNADGSRPRRLTHDPADDRTPFWGLGGKKILFASNRDMTSADTSEVWAMDSDGKGVTRLTFVNRH